MYYIIVTDIYYISCIATINTMITTDMCYNNYDSHDNIYVDYRRCYDIHRS